jgi:hypothetical protein
MNFIFRQLVFAAFLSNLFAGTALAEGVLFGHSGAWYNPEQPGHGLTIEVISPERVVVFWNTFDPQGNPVWLYIDGAIEGNVVLGNAYYVDGMVWGTFDPSTKNVQSWGTATLEFTDCNSAELVWNSEFPEYGQGQLSLVRLTSIYGLACHEFTNDIFGYYDVAWTETDTMEKHFGNAIIDTSGFMTTIFVEPQFGAMRMFGQVSATPSDEAEHSGLVDMDVQLYKTPDDPIEDLMLSGHFDFRTWPKLWVESESDSFEFSMNEEWSGTGAITQDTLVGEWWFEFAGDTHEVEIAPDGTFEWTSYSPGLAATFNYEMTLTVPQDGTPVLLATLNERFFNIDLRGNAVYRRSTMTGMDSIEIRAVDEGFDFRCTLGRVR